MKIQVTKELVINENIEKVWEVMGNQFAKVHLWSSNFKDSKPAGEAMFNGLTYSERVTVTDRGETIQTLDSFETKSFSLTYHITKGAPGIAKVASAKWYLKNIEVGKTMVVLEFYMETKGLMGVILSPLINKGMGKSATEIAEDLKFYIENRKPHPRKLAS